MANWDKSETTFLEINHYEKSVVKYSAVVQNLSSGMKNLFIFAVSIIFYKKGMIIIQ